MKKIILMIIAIVMTFSLVAPVCYFVGQDVFSSTPSQSDQEQPKDEEENKDEQETGTSTYGLWTDDCASAFENESEEDAGSPSNPYQIATAGQLARLSYISHNIHRYLDSSSDEYADFETYSHYMSASYKLTADINLSAHYWVPIAGEYSKRYSYQNGEWGEHGGGNYDYYNDLNHRDYQFGCFTGYFDGDGHTISGLNVSNSDVKPYAIFMDECNGYTWHSFGGLFAAVKGATIQNLTLYGDMFFDSNYSTASSGYSYLGMGAFTGIAFDSDFANLTNWVDMRIFNSNAGGLNFGIGMFAGMCGSDMVTFWRCYNYGDIDYRTYSNCTDNRPSIGGFIGSAYYVFVSRSFSYGNIELRYLSDDYPGVLSSFSIGGIVGWIRSSGSASEFLVCYVYGIISNVSDICVKWYGRIGGIVGTVSSMTSIESCYNFGSYIHSIGNEDMEVGGIVGAALDWIGIEECVNFADINIELESSIGKGYGGIVGLAWDGGYIGMCINYGKISCLSLQDIGGIAGRIKNVTVYACINYGNIRAGVSQYVGGIVGICEADSFLYNCVSFGDVVGAKSGGIVGSAAFTIDWWDNFVVDPGAYYCYYNSDVVSRAMGVHAAGADSSCFSMTGEELHNLLVNNTDESKWYSNAYNFVGKVSTSTSTDYVLSTQIASFLASRGQAGGYTSGNSKGIMLAPSQCFQNASLSVYWEDNESVRDATSDLFRVYVKRTNYTGTDVGWTRYDPPASAPFFFLKGVRYSENMSKNLIRVENIRLPERFNYSRIDLNPGDGVSFASSFHQDNVYYMNFQVLPFLSSDVEFRMNFSNTAGENPSVEYIYNAYEVTGTVGGVDVLCEKEDLCESYAYQGTNTNYYDSDSTITVTPKLGYKLYSITIPGNGNSKNIDQKFVYCNKQSHDTCEHKDYWSTIGVACYKEDDDHSECDHIKNYWSTIGQVSQEYAYDYQEKLSLRFRGVEYDYTMDVGWTVPSWEGNLKSYMPKNIDTTNKTLSEDNLVLGMMWDPGILDETTINGLFTYGYNYTIYLRQNGDSTNQVAIKTTEVDLDGSTITLTADEVLDALQTYCTNKGISAIEQNAFEIYIEREPIAYTVTIHDMIDTYYDLTSYQEVTSGNYTSLLGTRYKDFDDSHFANFNGNAQSVTLNVEDTATAFNFGYFKGYNATKVTLPDGTELSSSEFLSGWLAEYVTAYGSLPSTSIDIYAYYDLTTYNLATSVEIDGGNYNNAFNSGAFSLKTEENGVLKTLNYFGDSLYEDSDDPTKNYKYNEVYYYAPVILSVDSSRITADKGVGYRFVGWYKTNYGSYYLLSTNEEYVFETNQGVGSTGSPLNIVARFESYSTLPNGYVAPTKTNNIYQIDSANDLLWLSNQVKLGNSFEGVIFSQTADIDMSGMIFEPIGSEKTPFMGTYNGNNYTISNLKINNSVNGDLYKYNLSNRGLFGYVKNATIKKLTLVGGEVYGYANVGAFVGYAENSSFENLNNRSCAVSGSNLYIYNIYSYEYMITPSYFTYNGSKGILERLEKKSFPSQTGFGGIVGYAKGCDFFACSNYASVGGVGTIGGLIGKASAGTIDQCFNEGTGASGLVGEIVGAVNITNCYNKSSTSYILYNATGVGGNTQNGTYGTNDLPQLDSSIWIKLNNQLTLQVFYWN